mgnify:CR=1 FL=1
MKIGKSHNIKSNVYGDIAYFFMYKTEKNKKVHKYQ